MANKTRKSSPYFFRRIWSPFGHSIQAIRGTANIALNAVENVGKSVSGHLNDAVGNLTRPRRGGARYSRKNKSNKNSRRNKNRSRKNKNSRRH